MKEVIKWKGLNQPSNTNCTMHIVCVCNLKCEWRSQVIPFKRIYWSRYSRRYAHAYVAILHDNAAISLIPFFQQRSLHSTSLDAYKINNLIRKKKKKKFIRIRCVSLIWIDKFGINFNIKLVFFLGKIDENKRRTEFFWSLFLDSEKSL